MKKSNHHLTSVAAFILLITLLFTGTIQAFGAIDLQPYWNEGNKVVGISGMDISDMDLRDEAELVKTLTFDTQTKWPSKDRMPEGFDPRAVLEWGKDPGLGIKKLHEMGHTGKGVTIAYVDQPMLEGHYEYEDVNLIYTKIRPNNYGMDTSMHGPAVLSLLAGKDIGVAPESTVYFFGHPAWLRDQTTHAEALEKLIEINKSLPEDKKIKVVGFSDGPDTRENNIDAYREAIKKAEASGIMVIDVTSSLNIRPLAIKYPYDKNDPQYYETAHWYSSAGYDGSALFVPTSGRTTAGGESPDHYYFWTDGGFSWAVPYVTGTIALGLQIDPQLTKEEAFAYLLQSATPFKNGRIINPEGFLELVRSNCPNPRDVSKDKDFRYFVYNSEKVGDADLEAIKEYISKFPVSEEAVLVDVAGCKNASEVYNMLKTEKSGRRGTLKGIQIFGTSNDVPAFEIKYKIQTVKDIDEGGAFKSDHFYSNFNSAEAFDNISIYDAFKNKLDIDFVPQWPVSRLPLLKGEYADYMRKYHSYAKAVENKKIPVVNFSSPIFAAKLHSDDTGILLRRMRDTFKLIDDDDFRLYGNLQGLFPVDGKVSGDFSKESLIRENSAGICHFFINSHRQSDNIDQYIVDNDANLAKYADKSLVTSLGNSTSAFRLSLVNTGNINDVLAKNYYNIFSRSCNNAYNLDENNIIHEAMAKGMLVTAIANSQVNANNGMDVFADLEGLKKNNPAWNFMVYTYSLLSGNSPSRSFWIAKSAYVQEALRNKVIVENYGNYQYQLHNALVQSFLGLLEYSADADIPMDELLPAFGGPESNEGQNLRNSIVYNGKAYEIPLIKSPQKSTLSFADDGYAYCAISHNLKFVDPGFKLNELSVAVDNNNVFIKVKFYSPKSANSSIRLAGDAPGLSEWFGKKIVKGNNVVIAKLDKQKLRQFPTSVCLEVGDEQSITIDKRLTDMVLETPTDSLFFTVPGVRINGRLVHFDESTGYPRMDKKGYLFAPLHASMQAIGARVAFDGETGEMLIIGKGKTVRFTPGSNVIYRNGEKISLVGNTYVEGGVIYVPLSAFVWSLGGSFSYNKAYGVCDITPIGE